VFLTHSDGDHVNGLVAYPAGVKIIAHENNKTELQAAITAGGRGAPPADRLPSQVIVKGKETMTIDGVKLELYHRGPAHTNGDLIVYLPEQHVVATGDIIVANRADDNPNLHIDKHGSAEGWIANVKEIASLNADVFVPGHGDLQTKADIQRKLAAAREGHGDGQRRQVARGDQGGAAGRSSARCGCSAGGRGARWPWTCARLR